MNVGSCWKLLLLLIRRREYPISWISRNEIWWYFCNFQMLSRNKVSPSVGNVKKIWYFCNFQTQSHQLCSMGLLQSRHEEQVMRRKVKSSWPSTNPSPLLPTSWQGAGSVKARQAFQPQLGKTNLANLTKARQAGQWDDSPPCVLDLFNRGMSTV